ncbi:MAG TPA: type II toxin-antitoxin system prevent-host-death family antitoxin [Solirubrobacterales bacterium]
MIEVASKELRTDTDGLLQKVEMGETVVITQRGKPVAKLVPHRVNAPRWFTRDEVVAIVESGSADPALRADLERLAGDTTDDLGPIR